MCSFLRIPLKRGPSKGYIRDLEEKLDKGKESLLISNGPIPITITAVQQGLDSAVALSSAPVSSQFSSSLPGASAIPIPHHQQLPFPQNHLKSSPSINGSSPPIVLPPLVGYSLKILPKLGGATVATSGPASSVQPNSTTPTTTSIGAAISSSNPLSPRSTSINGLLNRSDLTTELNMKNTSPPIQGPFWKVPYEMPNSSSRRTLITLNNVQGNSTTSGTGSRRRSSIDSVSSTSTNGSRMPSLKPSILVNSDFISDSETEEFYSMKSNASSSISLVGPPQHNRSSSLGIRRNSQSLSPRNSVSSLSSLSGRINKSLHFQSSSNNSSASASLIQSPINPPSILPAHQQQQQQQQQQQPWNLPQYGVYSYGPSQFQAPGIIHPQPQPFQGQHFAPVIAQPVPVGYNLQPQQQQQIQQQQEQFGNYSKILMNSLEANLKLYYTHFHASFPILPFNNNHLIILLESCDSEEVANVKTIVELFNHSLNNLNNFKQLLIHDHMALFSRILTLYPFNNFGVKVNDTALVFFFLALVVINYAILLNGDVYSLGISFSATIFNDFKVLENFVDLALENPNPERLDYDNIKLVLPKLYYALTIIDNLYSLSFGIQKSIHSSELTRFLGSKLHYLMPILADGSVLDPSLRKGILIFKNSLVFNDLVKARDDCVISRGSLVRVVLPSLQAFAPAAVSSEQDDFSNQFISLIWEKFELITYLQEISQFMKNNNGTDVEEIYENLMDYNLKLIRLIKKLSMSIITFANYIGTTSSSRSPNINGAPLSISGAGPNSGATPPVGSNGRGGSGNENGPLASLNREQNSSADSSNGNIFINPLLNITIGQLFKLIKLSKMIIDSLINLIQLSQNGSSTSGHGHGDLMNRCIKINNDLSISFNLLNLNLINLQLGTISTNLIRNKINSYKFNFSLQNILNSSGPTLVSNVNDSRLKNSLQIWSEEFTTGILPFVEKENIDGWY